MLAQGVGFGFGDVREEGGKGCGWANYESL